MATGTASVERMTWTWPWSVVSFCLGQHIDLCDVACFWKLYLINYLTKLWIFVAFFVHYCVFIWCTKATSAHLPAVSLERLLITKWTPLFPGLNTLTGVPKKKNNPLTPRSHLYRGSMNMPQNTKTCVGPFVSLGMHHTTRDYNIS